jgi:ABC-type lipoprotein export system ATPase subunit
MHIDRISAVHVKKVFTNNAAWVTVLRDIEATFLSCNSYAITGISGSGKSTLLNIIAGFDFPSEGSLFFNNKPLDIFSADEKEQYAQRIIGFLFQKPYVIKELSVIENSMLPGIIAGQSYDEVYTRASELLRVVGLNPYQDVKPGVLSVGQQQRVSLARALQHILSLHDGVLTKEVSQ